METPFQSLQGVYVVVWGLGKLCYSFYRLENSRFTLNISVLPNMLVSFFFINLGYEVNKET